MTVAHTAGRALRIGVLDLDRPRLLRMSPHRESLAEYRETGGYRDLPSAATLLELVEESGVRGRGGAAFPLARKLRAVRSSLGTSVVVANGEEGEPASVKDRWLLRHRPHLILDGLRHAAHAVDADLGYVYVSDPAAERAMTEAVAEAGLPLDVRVVRVAPGYVAGEETAAVRYLNGGPALPADKPPRPFETGVLGRPTLVSNVETLANLPTLSRIGAADYRALGTDRSPGTFLLTLGGHVTAPGLYELPLGTPLARVLAELGSAEFGSVEPATGFLFGGYFGGVLNPRAIDLPLDYDSVSAAGSGLGCGAITVLGPANCPVWTAAAVMAYFDRMNAGQCGSCFNGTAALSATLSALVTGEAGEADLARLTRWSVRLKGRGACATLDGAAHLAASLLREFPDRVRSQLTAPCPVCAAAGPLAETPFAVAPPGLPAELELT